MAAHNEQLLTLKQVASMLQISQESVLTLVKMGKLKAHKVLSRWRFSRGDIDTYLQSTVTEQAHSP